MKCINCNAEIEVEIINEKFKEVVCHSCKTVMLVKKVNGKEIVYDKCEIEAQGNPI